MSDVRIIRPAERTVATPATPGMDRQQAFHDAGAWVGHVMTEAGVVTGWHTHPEYDTYIYVLKGDVTISRPQISSFIRRELVLLGTWNSKVAPAGRSEWDMVVRHVADGSLAVAPLISDVPDLADAGSVLDDVAQRRRWSNKIVFAVSEQARREHDEAVTRR